MLGRKIVFKTKTSPKKESSKRTGSSDRSLYQASQSLKTTAAAKRPRDTDQEDVILILRQTKSPKGIPPISEATLFDESEYCEVTRMKPKSIPDRFVVVKSKSDVTGEVFSAVSDPEHNSAPATPLEKTTSNLSRTNSAIEGSSLTHRTSHKADDKQKNDVFDSVLDETFITLLELNSIIKGSPSDRDVSKLEGKLLEYSNCLKKLQDQVVKTAQEEDQEESDKKSRNLMEIPSEVLDSLKEGVNPDWKLIENSEKLLTKAEENIKISVIIEKFLNIAKQLDSKLEIGKDC